MVYINSFFEDKSLLCVIFDSEFYYDKKKIYIKYYNCFVLFVLVIYLYRILYL